jgi:adenine-specific DNA methylase
LDEIKDDLQDRDILVYVDAPYKREDYSRYYHVLETLVSYSYPSFLGKAKIPNIKTNERFRSEFATRDLDHLTQALSDVMIEILRNNWTAAWSYANTGRASILNVLERVQDSIDCSLKSYSTPYQHQSQGRRKPKAVTEYLIVFKPSTC